MKQLIIYDKTGKIFYNISASLDVIEKQTPQGLPYLILDLVEDKRIVRVDTSKEPHTVIYADIEKTEVQQMQEQINNLNLALAELMGV